MQLLSSKISEIQQISLWTVNALLAERDDDRLGLRDLLPIDAVPELYDKAVCMMLAGEDCFKAKEIYENVDIVEVYEMLAVKNALNYYEVDDGSERQD